MTWRLCQKNLKKSKKLKKRAQYTNNQEYEKKKRIQRYKNNPEPEKQYNIEYHKRNRDIILHKMREYDKLHKPFRTAITEFKKMIKGKNLKYEFDPFHGNRKCYLTASAFHLYHHSLGKCNVWSVLNARHRIEEIKEMCDNCERKLYRQVGSNKLHCMNTKCRKTICFVCRKDVPGDPRQDFKHFYLHSGIMPGMCPLFEDFDSVHYYRRPCSNSTPCHSIEPTYLQLNDYGNRNLSDDLTTIPCTKCKEVVQNNPSMIEKCLKLQKYGIEKKDEKFQCNRTGFGISKEESQKFYLHKEFRFYNCYICGWGDKEKHERLAVTYKGGKSNFHYIPMTFDQKIFQIDHPNTPDSVCFGNKGWNLERGDGTYTNFEFPCNLNEHLIDHSPEGKSCIIIEVKLDDYIESEKAQTRIQEKISKLDNIFKLFEITNVFECCENYRLRHAYWDQFKRRAKTFTDHKEFVDNAAKSSKWITSNSACDFWKLGKCTDNNLIVIYLLLKRKSNPSNIFLALGELDFVTEWKLNFQEPYSNANKQRGGSCYCEGNAKKNPFCPIFGMMLKDKKRSKSKYEYEYEHIHDCILPGVKTYIDDGQDKLNILTEDMLNYFLPRFKVLLKYCQCEGKLCLGKAKGWNCGDCNDRNCLSGDFNYEDMFTCTKEQKLEMAKPYCITADQGKHILETEIQDNEYTSNNSDSDTEANEETSSEQCESEDESISDTEKSDKDGFMDQEFSD